MNDLNRAAASAEQIAEGVEKVLEARDRAEAQKRTQADLQKATARTAELEGELAQANEALQLLQAAVDRAYSGATTDTPPEIRKIDESLKVVGPDAGEATYAAKIAWIADSRKAVAGALVENKDVEADTKLIEENTALKAELTNMKQDLRKAEIEYLFASILQLEKDEVEKFVKAGLAKATDEEYSEWLEEKKVFAKKMMDLMKKKKDEKKEKDDAKAADSEAGLLETMDRNTPIDELGATLRPNLGRVPSDVARTPRSKLTAAADLDALFEEVNEPNLAGASEEQNGEGGSGMSKLVASLLNDPKSEKKED